MCTTSHSLNYMNSGSRLNSSSELDRGLDFGSKKRGPKKSREIREKSTRREGEVMELFVYMLRPPRSFARSAARGRCGSAFRHEYVRPKTACHSLCLSAQLPSEDVQRTSVEIGNHRNALLRHKGRVDQVEEIMPVPQEGASLRTGACNRAEHQRGGGMTHFVFPSHSRNRRIASC